MIGNLKNTMDVFSKDVKEDKMGVFAFLSSNHTYSYLLSLLVKTPPYGSGETRTKCLQDLHKTHISIKIVNYVHSLLTVLETDFLLIKEQNQQTRQ